MQSFDDAIRLSRLGRFGDALRALDQNGTALGQTEKQAFRVQLLEHVGEPAHAVSQATDLLRSKRLSGSARSRCECVIGRLLFDGGDREEGVRHLNRSVLLAEEASDPHTVFGAKLKLLLILSDRSGPSAISSVLADVREIATRLGDPEVTARLHLFIAESEAKRGLLDNAKRHIAIGRRLLIGAPNTYLEAFAANLTLAITVLRSELSIGMEHGPRAMDLAKQSGSVKIQRAVLGNMGNLFLELGAYERARMCFQSALSVTPSEGMHAIATLESLARVHLREGRSDLCVKHLDLIESMVKSEGDRLSYEHRYAALTRITVLASEGRIEEALSTTSAVMTLAENARDVTLLKNVQLVKADLLARVGRISDAMDLLTEIVPECHGVSPDFYAYAEQIVACALASTGDPSGEDHRDRALRICDGIRSVPRRTDVTVSWERTQHQRTRDAAGDGASLPDVNAPRTAHNVLQAIATVFAHATRPDIVATELMQVLDAVKCTATARVVVQKTNGGGDGVEPARPPRSSADSVERRL